MEQESKVKKGRPQGKKQKLRECQFCGFKQAANARSCKACGKRTGFWSEDIFIKRKDV